MQNSGLQSVTWDVSGNIGMESGGGLFMCVLKAGGYTQSIKLMRMTDQ
jgi:hypothetical protein